MLVPRENQRIPPDSADHVLQARITIVYLHGICVSVQHSEEVGPCQEQHRRYRGDVKWFGLAPLDTLTRRSLSVLEVIAVRVWVVRLTINVIGARNSAPHALVAPVQLLSPQIATGIARRQARRPLPRRGAIDVIYVKHSAVAVDPRFPGWNVQH